MAQLAGCSSQKLLCYWWLFVGQILLGAPEMFARQQRKKKEKFKAKREEFKQREVGKEILSKAVESGDQAAIDAATKKKVKHHSQAGSLRNHRNKASRRPQFTNPKKTTNASGTNATGELKAGEEEESENSSDFSSADDVESGTGSSEDEGEYDRNLFLQAKDIEEAKPAHIQTISEAEVNFSALNQRSFDDRLFLAAPAEEILTDDHKQNIVTSQPAIKRDELDDLLGLEEELPSIATLKINPKKANSIENLLASKQANTNASAPLSHAELQARANTEAQLDALLGL
jgi:hypothetical protein